MESVAGLSKLKQKPLLCDQDIRDYRVIILFDKFQFRLRVGAVG